MINAKARPFAARPARSSRRGERYARHARGGSNGRPWGRGVTLRHPAGPGGRRPTAPPRPTHAGAVVVRAATAVRDPSKRVVITGVGCCTVFGNDPDAFYAKCGGACSGCPALAGSNGGRRGPARAAAAPRWRKRAPTQRQRRGPAARPGRPRPHAWRGGGGGAPRAPAGARSGGRGAARTAAPRAAGAAAGRRLRGGCRARRGRALPAPSPRPPPPPPPPPPPQAARGRERHHQH